MRLAGLHDYRLCLLGGIAASDNSCSRTCKLQDVNAISVFKTMFIVLMSQGKSRKSREKCWDLDALTPVGGVWEEGMTGKLPEECLDWQGEIRPGFGIRPLSFRRVIRRSKRCRLPRLTRRDRVNQAFASCAETSGSRSCRSPSCFLPSHKLSTSHPPASGTAAKELPTNPSPNAPTAG